MCPHITQGIHAGLFWNVPPTLITMWPVITCWSLLKCPPKVPLGTFWMKTPGSFTIFFAMCPPWAWATHWGFFQNVSCNVTTMYPATTSWVLWEFVVKLNHIEVSLWLLWKEPPGDIVVTFQDTFWEKSQWVAQTHSGHIANKIVKEPRVFIQNVPRGYVGGDISKVTSMWSQVTLWSKWGVHFKRVQHVPPG